MSQNIMGRMLLEGNGIAKDSAQALSMFQKAAAQGLPNAMNNLGVMFMAGDGVTQNYQEGIYWLRRAADNGFGIAMVSLADIYEDGLGVKPDRLVAEKWREKAKAAKEVNGSSVVSVARVGQTEFNQGIEAYMRWDFPTAANWFSQSAKLGHPEAQLRLSIMLKGGQGIARNLVEAQRWADKAKQASHGMDDGRDRIIIIDAADVGSATPIDKIPKALRLTNSCKTEKQC